VDTRPFNGGSHFLYANNVLIKMKSKEFLGLNYALDTFIISYCLGSLRINLYEII
jgi:hypothetical protein